MEMHGGLQAQDGGRGDARGPDGAGDRRPPRDQPEPVEPLQDGALRRPAAVAQVCAGGTPRGSLRPDTSARRPRTELRLPDLSSNPIDDVSALAVRARRERLDRSGDGVSAVSPRAAVGDSGMLDAGAGPPAGRLRNEHADGARTGRGLTLNEQGRARGRDAAASPWRRWAGHALGAPPVCAVSEPAVARLSAAVGSWAQGSVPSWPGAGAHRADAPGAPAVVPHAPPVAGKACVPCVPGPVPGRTPMDSGPVAGRERAAAADAHARRPRCRRPRAMGVVACGVALALGVWAVLGTQTAHAEHGGEASSTVTDFWVDAVGDRAGNLVIERRQSEKGHLFAQPFRTGPRHGGYRVRSLWVLVRQADDLQLIGEIAKVRDELGLPKGRSTSTRILVGDGAEVDVDLGPMAVCLSSRW